MMVLRCIDRPGAACKCLTDQSRTWIVIGFEYRSANLSDFANGDDIDMLLQLEVLRRKRF